MLMATQSNAAERITFGPMLVDWETRIDFVKMRRDRLERARAAMAAAGVDYLVCSRIENCRYTTSVKRIYWPTLRTGGGPIVVIPAEGDPHIWITDLDYARITIPGVTEGTVHRAHEMDLRSGAEAFCSDLTDVFGAEALAEARVAVDLWTPAMREAFDERLPQATYLDGQRIMMDAQMIKTPEEIACLKMAYVISEAGMQAALERLRPGVRECELVAAAFQKFGELGSEVAQCSEVVNSGPGTHPYRRFHTDRIIQSGDFVNMDFGACFNGYFGDFCRAFVCGRKPTAEQQELLERAHELQQRMLAAIRPGVTPAELAAEVGQPRLGHGIGITANGPPSLHPDERFTLQPGMTFAVLTPAIFGTPEAGGVHLEDQVVVTDDGCQVYSTFPYFGIDD